MRARLYLCRLGTQGTEFAAAAAPPQAAEITAEASPTYSEDGMVWPAACAAELL